MVLLGLHPQGLRTACAVAVSAALHVALLLVIVSGGHDEGTQAGDEATGKLLLLHAADASRTESAELRRVEPAAIGATDAIRRVMLERPVPSLPGSSVSEEVDSRRPDDPVSEPAFTVLPEPVEPAVPPAPLPTRPIAQAERAALVQQLEQFAEELLENPRAEVSWERDGRRYSAVLIRERVSDGMALERAIAEVSAADGSQRLITRVGLNRLAFSQFTQMVDRWDPMVQLHDDEIVGRFHTNSRFNLLYDTRTAPKLLGKVTTAAGGFTAEGRGRRRHADIFPGGVQTRTRPIRLPDSPGPFHWASRDDHAHVHEFTSDARIRFLGSGGYTWRTRDAAQTQYVDEPTDRPVYLIAAPGVALHVKGVVAGRVLVYSPHRIVIEGSLVYQSHPRDVPESGDYLGLVCDRYVEVASPRVTGRGDLEIHAAIYAGRRFLVRHIDSPRAGTLHIYGSLTAGTLSATEPRYATRIEYDPRFERVRPPGFPSTNRYEVDPQWRGEWAEVQ